MFPHNAIHHTVLRHEHSNATKQSSDMTRPTTYSRNPLFRVLGDWEKNNDTAARIPPLGSTAG